LKTIVEVEVTETWTEFSKKALRVIVCWEDFLFAILFDSISLQILIWMTKRWEKNNRIYF